MKKILIFIPILVLTLPHMLNIKGKDAKAVETKRLERTMKGLGSHAAQLQMALVFGDLEGIKVAATKITRAKINDHPNVPSAERSQIQKLLGKDIDSFKFWENQVLNSAKGVKDAARNNDEKRAQAFQLKMLEGCYGCHNNFRAKIRQK